MKLQRKVILFLVGGVLLLAHALGGAALFVLQQNQAASLASLKQELMASTRDHEALVAERFFGDLEEAAELPADQLQAAVARLDPSGSALVLDAEGRVLRPGPDYAELRDLRARFDPRALLEEHLLRGTRDASWNNHAEFVADREHQIAPARLDLRYYPKAKLFVGYGQVSELVRVRLGHLQRTSRDRLRSIVLGGLAGLTLAVVLASAAAISFMRRLVLTPIARVERGVGQVSAGNLDVTLEPEADDEIGSLTRAFNAMSTALKEETLERQQAEAAVRANEREVQAIIDNATSVIYQKDLEGRYLRFNKQFELVTGYEREGNQLPTDAELFSPELAATFRENDREIVASDRAMTFEETVPHEDGPRTYQSTKFPLRSPEGELYGVGGVSTDVTDLVNALDEVRRHREDLRITLESIGDAVIATDGSGSITRANPQAAALTAWPPDELLGRPIGEVLNLVDSSGAEQPSPTEEVLRGGALVQGELDLTLIARDQSRKRVAPSCAPIRTGEGEVVGAVLVIRDVTRQRELEERLQHSLKMDAVGQLAGGVAHDFRNTLAGIMNGAELVKRSVPESNTQAHEFAEMILRAADQGATLSGRLLAFSRKENATQAPTDVHGLIKDVQAMVELSFDRRIHLQVDLAASEHVLVCDPSELQSAILNLFLNARDAMPQGGELRVASRNLELDAARCAELSEGLAPGAYLQLTFGDTGSGIPREVLPQIFDPFFTTKEPGRGTGLGLTAVHGCVERLGGAIEVESEPGQGATFELLLPLSRSEPTLEPAPEVEAGTGCVLVVEDQRLIRILAQHLLESLGYRVLVAADGAEGVEVFRAHADEIDVVLLDMIMPVMDGRACFGALQEADPEVRVLLATGFSEPTDTDELIAAGALGVLRKPYRLATLATALAEVLPEAAAETLSALSSVDKEA